MLCLGNALVVVDVSAEQAEELVGGTEGSRRRRLIQDIIPEVPAALREIFISGTTPAEFDKLAGRPIKAANKYPGYKILED